jgi:hypothetical protein
VTRSIERFICGTTLAALVALAGCSSDGDGAGSDAGTDAAVQVLLTHDEVVEACIRLGTCGVQSPRLSDCVKDFYGRLVGLGRRKLYEDMFRCANAGQGDCGAIRQCFGYARKPVRCTLASYTARCEGDVAHTCDGIAGWEQVIDCAKGGLKCGTKEAGTGTEAVCGGGSCVVGQYQRECRDKQLWQCNGGAIEIDDCTEEGLQCRDPAVGCEGPGRSCQDFAPECQGTEAVRCENGYVFRADCAKAPGDKRCEPTLAKCVPAGTECDQGATFDQCEGTTLTVCLDGTIKTFDCAALGFVGCERGGTYGNPCKAAPVYD